MHAALQQQKWLGYQPMWVHMAHFSGSATKEVTAFAVFE